MSEAIGIDFGTSNSAVGFFKNGSPYLVELEDKKQTIPSAIFYDTEEDAVLFGNEAISFYMGGCEGRLLRSLKSILGSSLINESTEIGYKNIYFKDIIVSFIEHLKSSAESTGGMLSIVSLWGGLFGLWTLTNKLTRLLKGILKKLQEKLVFVMYFFSMNQ